MIVGSMDDLSEAARRYGISDRAITLLEHRIPGNLNISFAYVEGESLMMGIKNLAVSSGSACTSASKVSAPPERSAPAQ